MKEINIVAPLNSLGFGVFSYGYLRVLGDDPNIKINLQPLGSDANKNWPGATEAKQIAESFGVKRYDEFISRPLNPDCKTLVIWHPGAIADFAFGDRVVGYTHFETNGFKHQDVEKMKVPRIERILVSNPWAVSVLERHGIEAGIAAGPVLPLYIDHSSIEPNEIITKATASKFTLLSSGKWEVRKGHPMIIDIVKEHNEPMILIGLWSNSFIGGLSEPMKYLKNAGFKLATKTKIFDNIAYVYTYNDISVILLSFIPEWLDLISLYKASDCFISLSSGEGWDLPITEAMSFGVPVIATLNTAHGVYIWENNSIMVMCHSEIARDGVWFKGDVGEWSPPIKENAMEALATAYTLYSNKPEALTELGLKGKATINQLCNKSTIRKDLMRYL
jgi:glycosyltransferase involved in cell wall biosynthesis